MIPSILKEGDLDKDTIMVLLNALAFDALWQQQPSDSACFDGNFTTVNGNAQTAKFMWAEANGYIEGKNEVGIVKNYKGGKYAFVALLPEGNVYDYAASLKGEDFLKLYDKRETVNVEISAKMPHFSFDCSIEMRKVLEKMGMPIAFNSASADFDAMGHSELGNIYISRVIQKTHIDLDNSGTRAAAVTAVIMEPECAAPNNIKYYRVELDRPFVYAIVDTEAGLPIFIGVCDNIK
jgi:serpin B